MTRILPAFWMLAFLVAACASTDSEITQEPNSNQPLPYPERILIHDFAVAPEDIDLDSAIGKKLIRSATAQSSSEEKSKIARAVAHIVTEKLVAEIKALGLPAERWSGPIPAMANGYTIEGQFLTIDEGNRARRVIIGFGLGGTEVQTLVQAYHVTGPTKALLGEAKVTAESSKKPGIAGTLPVGAAISGVAMAAMVSTGVGVVAEINQDVRDGAENTAEAIVALLKPRFVKQGWIKD